jgi:23S rRNA pseudouridine2457 synthase
MSDYFILNKPFGVLSKFTDKENRKTLAGLYNFPKDVYPVGRLDMDSEGLLLLSNDKELVDYLLNPLNKHEKEYFVQVEGKPDEESLDKLRDGVLIEGVKTLPAKVKIIDVPDFPPRNPPIRWRKNDCTTWISIIISEGKYRQVRKMTAKTGHPTLRLIRFRIKNLTLEGINPGEVRILMPGEVKELKES